MLRALTFALVTLALVGCARSGQIREGGIVAERSVCPQLGIPAGTGTVTLFTGDAELASNIDVTATMTNLDAQCYDDTSTVISTATFDVYAARLQPGPARQVVLPIFNVAMQGGQTVVAKQVGQVAINFADGALRAQGSGSATIRVDRSAVTLPADVANEITRRRRPGDVDAAIDPLSQPEVRAAVANATFEQLVGFQLTNEQLRYNVTR